MKKLIAYTASAAAGLVLVFVLTRGEEPAQTGSLTVHVEPPRTGIEPPGPEALERAPELETIPAPDAAPARSAGANSDTLAPALDTIERAPRRSAAAATDSASDRTLQILDATYTRPTLKLLHSGDLRFANGEPLLITWGKLENGGFVTGAGTTLEEGLNSTEHAPGVPASQGFVSGGLRTGLWTTWHANGEKESEGRYVYGKQHGSWTTWHASGAKRAEGEYLYGEREGAWIEFHADGAKLETATYVNGKRDGRVMQWHPDGARKAQAFHSFGRPHLECIEWHANGERASVGTYEYGKQVGRWRYWNPDATPDEERSGLYENDVRVTD